MPCCVGVSLHAASALVGSVSVCASVYPLHSVQACSGMLFGILVRDGRGCCCCVRLRQLFGSLKKVHGSVCLSPFQASVNTALGANVRACVSGVSLCACVPLPFYSLRLVVLSETALGLKQRPQAERRV